MRIVRAFLFAIWLLVGVVIGNTDPAWAGLTFLNRQAYPLPLVLNEIGPFHKNYLHTFEVLTQWSNDLEVPATVPLAFVVFDNDSRHAQAGEDGSNDPLMTIEETVTIPRPSNY